MMTEQELARLKIGDSVVFNPMGKDLYRTWRDTFIEGKLVVLAKEGEFIGVVCRHKVMEIASGRKANWAYWMFDLCNSNMYLPPTAATLI